jgi:hypothetical protein
MINDTYPIRKRDKLSPDFDPTVLEEFDKANKRATFCLYEQRNIAQDRWLPRYDITHIGKHHETEDWLELKSLLVDNCLDRVAELLIALSPTIVAKEYVDGLQEAVLRVAEIEKRNLTDYLKAFYVARKPGIPTIKEDFA